MARKASSKSRKGKPKGNGAGPACHSVPDELKEFYRFMLDNGLQSIEFDKKDLHIRLVRKGKATVPVPVPVALPPQGPSQGGGVPAPSGTPAVGAPPPPGAPAEAMPANAVALKSPMMGVFYRAASPSSPPFVKDGDVVKPGDVLGLIEAMKVFNDIKAETSGKILRVLLENGKPVKVGQDIFWIERT